MQLTVIAEWAQVVGAGAGQAEQGGLGRGVGVAAGGRAVAHDRRDVNHPAPLPFLHPGHQSTGKRHARAEVELDELVPEVVVDLVDRAGACWCRRC